MSEPLSVLVGGSVAIDHIKTPAAEAANLLGGSASYAALAASHYKVPVHLIGIIGKDFPQEHVDLFENAGISLEGLERSEGDSFSWTGEYHENMNDRTTRQVDINVLENWSVKVPSHLAASPVVVLANMHPENQMQLLDQLSGDRAFVLADTMDLWISIANERLHDVLKRIDLFVINESEAREFAGTSNLIVAGQRLLAKGPRYVVIKLGEFGAILFTGSGPELRLFRCAAFPLSEVADPTGAGDSFLGAIAGHLAAAGQAPFGFEDIRSAVAQGSVVASFTCEAFSTRRLAGIERADIEQRLEFLKTITSW